MSTSFSRTMRSLSADSGRRALLGILGAAVALSLWAAWLTLARVPVYERSASARVEVDGAASPVESAEAGRVVSSRMSLGRRVSEGEVLIELDVRDEALARDEAASRLDAITPQLDELRAQLAAANRRLTEGSVETAASAEAARARVREVQTLAANARTEAERAERSRELGHAGAADAERARALAESRAAAAEALASELRRVAPGGRSQDAALRGEVARLRGELARLEGERGVLRATIERIANRASRRLIRAPVSGILGEAAALRPGMMVGAGQRVATVVPDGELRVVASFTPGTALGRVRVRQAARLRLDGYPWAQWGTVPAVVRSVGSEVREGLVRVELAFPAPRATRIPLEHGLPGEVEVEVERVSPAVLALRAAGQSALGPRARRSP